MPLKVVFFYRQAARGWTESYYALGSSPQSFSTAYINTNTVAPFVNFRANDVYLTEVRVSLIGSPRITYSTPFLLGNSFVFEDDVNYNQDTYGEDALILLRSASGIPRHVWLRGLPNQYILYNGAGFATPPAEFLTKLGALQSAITQMTLCVQNANIPTPSSGSWTNVTFVASGPVGAQPNSQIQVPSLPAGLTPPYPPLYFQGVPRNLLPGFPRIITPGVVIAATPPAFPSVYVPYLYRGATVETYPPKMKFAILSYSYNPITSLAFEDYGTRKTGRPSGLPRGRTSVVLRRQ